MKRIPTEQITGDRKPVYSIYELMGMKVNPYKHSTIEEYRAFLTDLTFADMQDHAVNEAGTIPFDSREKLTQHLERQFLTINGQMEAIKAQNEEIKTKEDDSKKKPADITPESKRMNDLLSRAR